MTTVLNSFEGGTSGTTVTAGNSGGASGTAFDLASAGSGATLAYDSAQAAHGLLSCKVSTVASATAFTQWNSAGVLPGGPTWFFRAYFWFTGNPGSQVRLFNLTNSSSGSVSSLLLSTGGKLLVTYSSGGTNFVTFTTSVPLGAWFRVEGVVTGSASAGQVGASLYTGDSATPAETHTSAANLNTGSVASGNNLADFALSSSVASIGPFWMDDVGISNTAPVGPWTPPAGGGSASYAAALAASM